MSNQNKQKPVSGGIKKIIGERWKRVSWGNVFGDSRPVPNQSQVLEKIEKIIGKKLKMVGQGLDETAARDTMLWVDKNGYVIDNKQDIIGLGLYDNDLTDISFLQELNTLTYLNLMNTNITDMSPLRELKTLTNLNLYDNDLADISFLQELTNLTTLNLGKNDLTDISPLRELINLTRLDLRDNDIADIISLQGLTNLTTLDLGNNDITDISPLGELIANNEAIRINTTPPPWFLDRTNIFHFYNNPLKIPPMHIVEWGRDDILGYLRNQV